MALPFKINASGYNALSDEFKAEYIAGDKDGEYVLDVSGLPEPEDTGPLKRALEAEKNAHKATKAKRDELQVKVDSAPDVEKLKADHAAESKKYKDFTEAALIDGAALSLATSISTSPKLLVPHIKARLLADTSGDTPATKVLDKDGKPSDLTLEKLGEEFLANKEFGSIMIASKARGGGAPRDPIKPSGGGAPAGEPEKFDASKAKPADLAARITARKEAQAQQQA